MTDNALLVVVDRADRAEAKLLVLTDILREHYQDISDKFDVVDGAYGEPRPNQWMALGTNLAYDIRRKTGIDITKGRG